MTRQTAAVVAVGALAAILLVTALSVFVLRPTPSGTPVPPPGAALPAATTPGPTATVPSSNASPTATGTAPAASASAGPAPVPDDRYGYVFVGQEGSISVRRERDPIPMSMQGATSPSPGPAAFELRGLYPAVSSDGRRIAYWRTTNDIATDLRVLEVADLRSDRSVLTVTARRGGALAWSNDGQGLLVATCGLQGVGPFGAPSECDLETVDLTTTPASARRAAERLGGGRVFLPIGWDRAAQVAAAVVTGEGGYATEYVTWRGRAATPFASVQMPRPLVIADRVRASPDAKLVLALEDSLTGVRVWPLEDVTKAESITHPSRILAAFWRPGAAAPYEVIWVVGDRIELVAHAPGRPRVEPPTVLYTGTGSLGVTGIRPDGSAMLIADSSGGPPPPSTGVFLVHAGTRQAVKLATTTGSVHALPYGVLLR